MISKPFIALPTHRGVELINVDELVYIRSDGKNCIFHFENDGHKMVNSSIGRIENILKKDNMPFVRCHQQYIVNVFKIKQIFTGSKGLELSNGKKFNITRTYKEKFREMMMGLCCKVANGL